jgi:Cu-Zn family superoxide dismutase
MKKAESKLMYGLLALLLVPAAGCFNASGDGPSDPTMIGQGQGVLTVFNDVMGGNPIPMNATAAAVAWDMGGSMRLTLAVAGFPASRDFGAHLHKDPCDTGKAGGHYQHNVAPMEQVSTPAYANTTNEAWLDFTTKADGTASVETIQPWVPRAGGAKAIIIHAMRTDMNGKAGDKLACLPMALP